MLRKKNKFDKKLFTEMENTLLMIRFYIDVIPAIPV